MDYLLICAKAFEHLLDIKYHIVLGRKGQLTELNILFEPSEFHHLIGLHKLRDLRIARGNREKIFFQILSGKISMDDLKKSQYFSDIQNRIEPFYKIEDFLDRQNKGNCFFCRSFFQKGSKDYTKGQAIYTLLKKEKITISSGEKIIQYDRLTCKGSKNATSEHFVDVNQTSPIPNDEKIVKPPDISVPNGFT